MLERFCFWRSCFSIINLWFIQKIFILSGCKGNSFFRWRSGDLESIWANQKMSGTQILFIYLWNSRHCLEAYFVGWYKRKRTNLKTDVSRKQSTLNFPKNEHFLPPKTHFSENLAYFVFLKHPCWNSTFCLITNNLRKFFYFTFYDEVQNYKIWILYQTWFYATFFVKFLSARNLYFVETRKR